jgi:hypothetical protein
MREISHPSDQHIIPWKHLDTDLRDLGWNPTIA